MFFFFLFSYLFSYLFIYLFICCCCFFTHSWECVWKEHWGVSCSTVAVWNIFCSFPDIDPMTVMHMFQWGYQHVAVFDSKCAYWCVRLICLSVVNICFVPFRTSCCNESFDWTLINFCTGLLHIFFMKKKMWRDFFFFFFSSVLTPRWLWVLSYAHLHDCFLLFI